MSIIIAEENANKNNVKTSSTTRRGPTSMFIDRTLWTQVRKTAFDLEITATEFVEAALKEELKRVDSKEKE